jgi:ATP-dependent exoDNAse (exonuclease V) beta subunit
VRSYLQTLAEFDHQALDLTQLEEAVETLFAAADSSEQSQQIEIMTMHKSKGLEFDTVILPGLEKLPRNDDPELLSWFQFMDPYGQEQLVLAPLDQKGASKSPLTSLLRRFEKQKQEYELGRLLYVACTRAKTQLHLFAQLKLKADDDEQSFSAGKGTMLEAMWPAVKASAQQAISKQLTKDIVSEEASEVAFPEIVVPRLPLEHSGVYSQWPHIQAPQLKVQSLHSVEAKAEAEISAEPESVTPAYWQGANLVSKAAGNLVHLLLEQWARQGIENIAEDFLNRQENFLQRWLAQQGLDNEQQTRAWDKAQRCLSNAYRNPQLRWALSANQQNAISEYELQSLDDKGEVALHIIDRTLIDDQGTRWIIDYKTSACVDCDSADKRQAFITEQCEYYRPQLQRYGNLMSAQENYPQKWVLYLAEIDEWVEVKNC